MWVKIGMKRLSCLIFDLYCSLFLIQLFLEKTRGIAIALVSSAAACKN